jgi:cytochrome oxidase Cu insertion factor (SCO1/SenC/PrrC family)
MDKLGNRSFLISALLLACVFQLSAKNGDQSKKSAKAAGPAAMKLKVGDMAPDFSLLSFDGKDLKKVSLHDYRGKKSVALAFYVFAFTGG